MIMRNSRVWSIISTLMIINCVIAHHHHLKEGEHVCLSGWSLTRIDFNKTNSTGIPMNPNGTPLLSAVSPTTSKESDGGTKSNGVIVEGKNTPNKTLIGFPCLDRGVLYSCQTCKHTLKGKDCYKKLASGILERTTSGTIECTNWYSRTAYGEGGGVFMCGDASAIYQCSGDKHATKCQSCEQVRVVSTT